MTNKNPLVTIRVSTYNSSKYVIETLESAKKQTYKNIELIIGDDCSIDNTVTICRDWLEKNKERFVRTELITVDHNTGISANLNRTIKAARGEWIKGIAGDDILKEDCIETFIKAAEDRKDIMIFGGLIQVFENNFSPDTFISLNNKDIMQRIHFGKITSSEKQYQLLLRFYLINTPTLFISKKVFQKILYNEDYKKLEDYPFMLDVLKFGFNYICIDKIVVYYRRHNNSLSSNTSKEKLFNDFYKVKYPFEKTYKYPYLNKLEWLYFKYIYFVHRILDNDLLNRNLFVNKLIYNLLLKINPFEQYFLINFKKLNSQDKINKKHFKSKNEKID